MLAGARRCLPPVLRRDPDAAARALWGDAPDPDRELPLPLALPRHTDIAGRVLEQIPDASGVVRRTESLPMQVRGVYRRAFLAEPGQGLVVITRGHPIQAIYARELGRSVAIVLSSPHAIGVGQTANTGDARTRLIEEWITSFRTFYRKQADLTLVFSRSGLRQDLKAAIKGSGDALSGVATPHNRFAQDIPPGETRGERWSRLLERETDHQERAIQRLGRQAFAAVTELQGQVLAVQLPAEPGEHPREQASPPQER